MSNQQHAPQGRRKQRRPELQADVVVTPDVEVPTPEELQAEAEYRQAKKEMKKARKALRHHGKKAKKHGKKARKGFLRRMRRRFRSAMRRLNRAIKRWYKATKKYLKAAAKWTWKSTKKVGHWGVVGAGWTGTVVLGATAWALKLAITATAGIIFGLLYGLGFLTLGLAFLAVSILFGFNKYVVGPFKYMKSRGNEEDRADWPLGIRDWYQGQRWFSDQQVDQPGTYREFADSWWSGVFFEEKPAVGARKVEPIPLEDIPLEEAADIYRAKEKSTGEKWTEPDSLFQQEVSTMIENEMEELEENFPGAEVLMSSPTEYEILPENWFEEINETVSDVRKFDFSVYDNHAKVMDLYAYMRDQAGFARDIQRYSYWEGRRRMLEHFMHDSDYLDQNGRAWALTYTALRSKDNISIPYARVGFKEEVATLERRRNRQQASRTPAKPQPPKKQTQAAAKTAAQQNQQRQG